MDQSNRAVLMRTLEDQIMLNRFGQRQLLYSSLGSYHEFLATMGENIPMRTKADYENYLARLALVPARMQAYSDMSVKAAAEGYTQACAWMKTMPASTLALVPADVTQSPFYGPFAATRPQAVSAADWTALQGRAREVIGGPIAASYRSFSTRRREPARPEVPQGGFGLRPAGRQGLLRGARSLPHDDRPDARPDPPDRAAGSRAHPCGDGVRSRRRRGSRAARR